MEECSPIFRHSEPEISLPIDDISLLRLISSSPVASVQFFRTLFEAFLYILVGIPPPEQQNEVPLCHPMRRGIWGVVTDINIVHETNGRYIFTCYFNISFIFKLTYFMRRGCLHFHTPLCGVLSPYLLQSIVHAPMFKKALETVYNSMVTAQLPMHLHVKYLLERSDPALISGQRNYAAIIPGSIDITEHAHIVAYDKQFHSSLHNNSCVNRFLPYCRYIAQILFYYV